VGQRIGQSRRQTAAGDATEILGDVPNNATVERRHLN
jgi:hypothetical protein